MNNNEIEIKIGTTTYIVGVKQSQQASKSLDQLYKDMCKHDVLGEYVMNDTFTLGNDK